EISYIFRVLEKSAQLEHLYFGKKVSNNRSVAHLIEREIRPSCNRFTGDHTSSFEHIKQEYPSYGTTDFRYPAYSIISPNGSHISNFVYVKHEVINGKPPLSGLPHTYVENDNEAETLMITLQDKVLHVDLKLYYTIYNKRPVITRHSEFINHGNSAV